MKKYLLLIALVGGMSALVASCSSSDDSEPVLPMPAVVDMLSNYFSIEGANYVEAPLPAATDNVDIPSVTSNGQVLAGGTNFLTVVSNEIYDKFFVGLDGLSGYYETAATLVNSATRAGETVYVYRIVLIIADGLGAGSTRVLLSAHTPDNKVTNPYVVDIQVVSSVRAALNINLTFDQEKDVDLHLVMPDGRHIYYGNRDGSNGRYYTRVTNEEYEAAPEYEPTIFVGLDHDSNAGCSIDGLNNENIAIPYEYLMAGQYRVIVDMYSNCSPQNDPTSWSVIAKLNGMLVANEKTEYSNPAYGVYAANCGSDDMTEVMTFTVPDALGNPNAAANWASLSGVARSRAALEKLMLK